MRHRVAGTKLDRPSQQRMLMFRSQVTDLLKHDKITTTLAKGRETRSLAEKMITLGKRGSLHARRQAAAFITDEAVVIKVFSVLAPKYADRNGGYTRLMKIGQRQGDSSKMVIVELV